MTTAGAVHCWGNDFYGQLGVPDQPASATPRLVPLPVPAAQLSVGADHSCVTGVDGAVYCWGRDDVGQLGARPLYPTGIPAEALFGTTIVRVTVGAPLVSVAAGEHHTCALTAQGEAYCWGLDEQGQLGAPATLETCSAVSDPYYCRPRPAAVQTTQRFTQLALGTTFTCGLTVDGAVYCWGATNLGRGTAPTDVCASFARTGPGPHAAPCDRVPLPVAGGARFTALSPRPAAFGYPGPACGVRDDGAVLCWAGIGVPAPAPGLGDARTVSVSDAPDFATATRSSFGCIVTTGDAVRCWGSNRFGQLGVPGIDTSATPVTVTPPGSPAVAVSTGATHACSVTRAGQAVCWGNPRDGRLGRGS